MSETGRGLGDASVDVGRFAPSTTGAAHPGTLLAALLCWLDSRSRGGRLLLRLEDLDPERSRPELTDALPADLAWLGLDWDELAVQSQGRPRHEAALDALARAGLLYPCACSRSEIRSRGQRARDGSFRYPNTCRGRPLPARGWRESSEALRVALPSGPVEVRDEGGSDLSADLAVDFGDPVVRRRDGAVAYHLASVVDDAASGVTRVVRGRDLAPSTALQVALQRLLGLPTPVYRHHLLLLEEHRGKLAKLHGAVSLAQLRPKQDAQALCSWLAQAAGLEAPARATPASLLAAFDWSRVVREDRIVRFTGGDLVLVGSASEEASP